MQPLAGAAPFGLKSAVLTLLLSYFCETQRLSALSLLRLSFQL
jgi:hypothetical protein